MTMVFLLFGLRLFILWKGYMNPLQFGDIYTHPNTRLRQFVSKEPELFKIISEYYTDDERSQTVPVPQAGLEGAHNQFIYSAGELKESLDQVAAEPLSEKSINSYRQCNTRLELAMSLENNLFAYLEQRPGTDLQLSESGLKLQQTLHESLRTLIDTTAMAVESRDPMDFSMLESLTSNYRQRFDNLRSKYYVRQRECGDVHLEMVLQSTHKVERIIFLLSDYVRLRLDKKEIRAGNPTNRKTQQVHTITGRP
jgi:polar amino acid transport system substrate-binding protein